jgi:hypothetical protein
MTRTSIRPGPLWIITAVVILSSYCSDHGSAPPGSAVPPGPAIEAELQRLEETYRILDRFHETLWPGWRDYADLTVQVNFPNGVVLLVTPKAVHEPGFKRLDGRIIAGKAVFINAENRTTAEIGPPLFAQRARGGRLLIVEMAQPDLPGLEAERPAALEALLKDEARPDAPFDLAPRGDSDSHILMYIHEHFHGHQAKVQRRDLGDAGLKGLEIAGKDPNWSRVEGLALRRAYLEADDAAAREYLKDFVVARGLKRGKITSAAAAAETQVADVEGPASYVSLRTALLLKGAEARSGIDRAKDPYFYDFAYVDGYIDNIMRKGMDFACSLPPNDRNRYYLYGAYQGFLLDRFSPDWKRGFLEKGNDLDTMMADLLHLTSAEKVLIAHRLPTRYGADEPNSSRKRALKK